jgi:hypothetical protein
MSLSCCEPFSGALPLINIHPTSLPRRIQITTALHWRWCETYLAIHMSSTCYNRASFLGHLIACLSHRSGSTVFISLSLISYWTIGSLLCHLCGRDYILHLCSRRLLERLSKLPLPPHFLASKLPSPPPPLCNNTLPPRAHNSHSHQSFSHLLNTIERSTKLICLR